MEPEVKKVYFDNSDLRSEYKPRYNGSGDNRRFVQPNNYNSKFSGGQQFNQNRNFGGGNRTIQQQAPPAPSLTEEELEEKLKDKIRIKKNEEFINIKIGTWVSYVNRKTKQYRVGGKLEYLGIENGIVIYLALVNPRHNFKWCAKVDDNRFYIENIEEKTRITREKERVFEAYLKGRLVLKDTENSQALNELGDED